MEQLPIPGGMLPLNLLELRSSIIKNGELLHKFIGIFPIKLLLLALSVIRFSIAFHVVDGNRPSSKLLEMFSTCRGCVGLEDGISYRPPVRRLKLTSRTMRLLDETNSNGKPPDNKLCDRFSCNRPVRLPRHGDMDPSRPREGNKTSVTVLLGLQVIPSHLQQSMLLRHDAVRPPSRDSPARSWRRELFSCSVQELAGETKETIRIRAKPKKGMGISFLCV